MWVGHAGPGAHREFFLAGSGGGADPEAVYSLFDFKDFAIKSSCKYNITLFAIAFIYVRI
jgi:hypothetical protein